MTGEPSPYSTYEVQVHSDIPAYQPRLSRVAESQVMLL